MRKIHITEEQLDGLKRALNEINLSGDEALNANNGNATAAARQTIQNAKKDGVAVDNSATSVSFSQDAMKRNGISEGTAYTKKQIKDAKVKALRENSVAFKKSDLSK